MKHILILFAVFSLISCGSQSPVRVVKLKANKQLANNVYIVKPHDTLYSIARTTGINYLQLGKINKLQPPFALHIGQKLLLTTNTSPSSRFARVIVKPNHANSDSIAVASNSKLTNSAIAKANNNGAINTTANSNNIKPALATSSQSAIFNAAKQHNLTWVWPTSGPILAKFTVGSTKKKNGIDIGASLGSAVKAAASGRVVYSGNGLRGYGNLIIIKHSNNFLTAYAHNKKNIVAEGATVNIGQTIAEIGNTGTNKVMLHFEIRYNGVPLDPEKLLPPQKL